MVYQCTLANVWFGYGTVDRKRINLLAKLAAAAPFANFANIANNRCESSLTPPMIHRQCAENEDIFAITFGNFANLNLKNFATERSPLGQIKGIKKECFHTPSCFCIYLLTIN
jgi:hypothetical protein